MAKRQTKAEKAADALIERTYVDTSHGIAISIMDIDKVYAEGRKALAEGRDLRLAIMTFVDSIALSRDHDARPPVAVGGAS